MASDTGPLRTLRCRPADLGLGETMREAWPGGEVMLTSVNGADGPRCVLALPSAVLSGSSLTDFLARVAPFGCPPPPSLIRAYSLPDAMHPSILLREHEEAPDDVGHAYRRFLARSRLHWLAALNETGPGLCPALGWRPAPDRRFLAAEEWPGAPTEVGIGDACVPDTHLGRALLMLADADLAAPWPTMMSLGGVTKARKMTGREFPVWVDLAAHQPALLASRVLARAEQLLS